MSRYFKSAEDIRQVIADINHGLARVTDPDSEETIRRQQNMDNSMARAANVLDALTEPTREGWPVSINFINGTEETRAVILSKQHGEDVVCPARVKPGEVTKLRFNRLVTEYFPITGKSIWVPHYGLGEMIGVPAMAKAMKLGGQLVVSEEIDEWLRLYDRSRD